MSRVFLVDRPRSVDPSLAGKFGTITYFYERGGSERPSVFSSQEFMEHIQELAEEANFDPTKDYFALTGSLIPVTLTVSALLQRFGTIQLLLYSSVEGVYVTRTIKGNHDAEVSPSPVVR